MFCESYKSMHSSWLFCLWSWAILASAPSAKQDVSMTGNYVKPKMWSNTSLSMMCTCASSHNARWQIPEAISWCLSMFWRSWNLAIKFTTSDKLILSQTILPTQSRRKAAIECVNAYPLNAWVGFVNNGDQQQMKGHHYRPFILSKWPLLSIIIGRQQQKCGSVGTAWRQIPGPFLRCTAAYRRSTRACRGSWPGAGQ